VIPGGQGSVAWFTLVALLAIVILSNVGSWYKRTGDGASEKPAVG
jgi:FSR family fosmidomycin resistance protein-like MFS transporter